MIESVLWRGGIDGEVVVGGRAFRSTSELLRYIQENGAKFGADILRELGAITFFLALREYGRTNEPVLPLVRRALESFYPVLDEERFNEPFQMGMKELQDGLFGRRGEGYETLLAEAYSRLQLHGGLSIVK